MIFILRLKSDKVISAIICMIKNKRIIESASAVVINLLYQFQMSKCLLNFFIVKSLY